MAAIKTLLLPTLRERFPSARFDDPDPEVIVRFAGPAELGELKIWDDGDEVRVGIGELTHIHITVYESEPYDADLSKEETSKRVAKEVIKFLEDFLRSASSFGRSREGWSPSGLLRPCRNSTAPRRRSAGKAG